MSHVIHVMLSVSVITSTREVYHGRYYIDRASYCTVMVNTAILCFQQMFRFGDSFIKSANQASRVEEEGGTPNGLDPSKSHITVVVDTSRVKS